MRFLQRPLASGWGVEKMFYTSFPFIPIPLARFPPLAKGGSGGVVPAELGALYAVPGQLGSAEFPARPRLLVIPCPPPLTPPSQACHSWKHACADKLLSGQRLGLDIESTKYNYELLHND